MAEYTWHRGRVPEGIRVTQVYGIIFSEDGKMLISADNGHYTLPGGKPEIRDEDLEATLRREIYEEVNVTVGETCTVGY